MNEHLQININWWRIFSWLWQWGVSRVLSPVLHLGLSDQLIVLQRAGVVPPLPSSLLWMAHWWAYITHSGYTEELICFLQLRPIQKRSTNFPLSTAIRVLRVSRSLTILNIPSPCHHKCTSAGWTMQLDFRLRKNGSRIHAARINTGMY